MALFCQGLLAGVMTWQVVTTSVSSRHNHQAPLDDHAPSPSPSPATATTTVDYYYANLHDHYCSVSAPMHSVYLMLFSICCIASFDRLLFIFLLLIWSCVR